MKKLLLMLLAAGLFSFGSTSCDSGRETTTEENVEGDIEEGGEEVEDAAEDVGEEVEEGAEEVEEGVREE